MGGVVVMTHVCVMWCFPQVRSDWYREDVHHGGREERGGALHLGGGT